VRDPSRKKKTDRNRETKKVKEVISEKPKKRKAMAPKDEKRMRKKG